jgi:hypothetical protein
VAPEFFCEYQRYISLAGINTKKKRKNQIVIKIQNSKSDSAPTQQNFFPAGNQPSVIHSTLCHSPHLLSSRANLNCKQERKQTHTQQFWRVPAFLSHCLGNRNSDHKTRAQNGFHSSLPDKRLVIYVGASPSCAVHVIVDRFQPKLETAHKCSNTNYYENPIKYPRTFLSVQTDGEILIISPH